MNTKKDTTIMYQVKRFVKSWIILRAYKILNLSHKIIQHRNNI